MFLIKGVKLQGAVASFDSFSIQLRRGGTTQLVYKHAISTIVPTDWPADIEEGENAPAAKDDGDHSGFLADVRERGSPMTLFLVNGVMLEGTVADFDQYCVVLRRAAQGQLIYKHAISTLQPNAPAADGQQQDRELAEEHSA